MVFKVAIVGAGVIGLSCATVIQERFPDVAITLFAEKFSPGTTSDGAAGLFAPYLIGDTPAEEVKYEFQYLNKNQIRLIIHHIADELRYKRSK